MSAQGEKKPPRASASVSSRGEPGSDRESHEHGGGSGREDSFGSAGVSSESSEDPETRNGGLQDLEIFEPLVAAASWTAHQSRAPLRKKKQGEASTQKKRKPSWPRSSEASTLLEPRKHRQTSDGGLCFRALRCPAEPDEALQLRGAEADYRDDSHDIVEEGAQRPETPSPQDNHRLAASRLQPETAFASEVTMHTL